MNNEAVSGASQLYPGRGRPQRTVKEGSTVLQNLSRLFGAWLSLVERFVRDEEVARSNRVAPKFFLPPLCQDERRRGTLVLEL
jgi:hypothetical protein